jgi:hypothetical protein
MRFCDPGTWSKGPRLKATQKRALSFGLQSLASFHTPTPYHLVVSVAVQGCTATLTHNG